MEKSETQATLLWVFIEAITIWGILHMWQQAPCLSFFLIIQDKVVNQIFTVPSLVYFLKWLKALNFLKIQLKDLIEYLLPVISPRLKRQIGSTIFRWAGLYHLPGHMLWFPIDYGINSCQEYISAGSDLTTQGQTTYFLIPRGIQGSLPHQVVNYLLSAAVSRFIYCFFHIRSVSLKWLK